MKVLLLVRGFVPTQAIMEYFTFYCVQPPKAWRDSARDELLHDLEFFWAGDMDQLQKLLEFELIREYVPYIAVNGIVRKNELS